MVVGSPVKCGSSSVSNCSAVGVDVGRVDVLVHRVDVLRRRRRARCRSPPEPPHRLASRSGRARLVWRCPARGDTCGKRVNGSRSASAFALGGRAVLTLVVRQRVAVRPDDVGMHQRRSLPGACIVDGLGEHVEDASTSQPSTSWMNRSGKSREQLGDRAAGRVHLDRDRDRVPVVLDQEDDRKLEIGGGVERLPELALAGRAVTGGAEAPPRRRG